MGNKLTAIATETISIPVSNVWQALIDPALIKHYLYGTEVISDWKKGSTIIYKGEWQGNTYEDKGTILEIEPKKLLHTTYFSSLSGKEDIPENYANVIYSLSEGNKQTILTITQDNLDTEHDRIIAVNNWKSVLQTMKEFLENGG